MKVSGSGIDKHCVTAEQVERVLSRARPYLQRDGGDIELLEVVNGNATVRLSGHCVGCPSAHLTLYVGIETALCEEIPGFGRLIVV
jgi:Fe-S cluster biogenesis protein NfuA